MRPTASQITEAAEVFAAEPTCKAVAFWTNESGTAQWGQGTADNRRSRVLGRIDRFGMSADPDSLAIVHKPTERK